MERFAVLGLVMFFYMKVPANQEGLSIFVVGRPGPEYGLPVALSGVNENMCLAVPSKIVEIKEALATVDVDGVRREASLLLLEDVKIGDYVILHAGFAISKVDEEVAKQALVDMRNMLDAVDAMSNKPV